MKKFLGLACVLTMAVSMLAGCGSTTKETKGETTAAAEKIIMATEAGFAPYEYTEDGQTVIGVDVDIANEIATALGKELVIQNMTFDGALLAVQEGSADFVAAGISVTPERQEVMDFTMEYATSKQVIVVKKGVNAITAPEDIKEGVYKVTFSTTGREFKIHTTDYTEVGQVVGLTFFPEDIHVMSKVIF